MYKLTTYLKDLPLQSVSSKKNLQVVETDCSGKSLRYVVNLYIYSVIIYTKFFMHQKQVHGLGGGISENNIYWCCKISLE